MAASRIDNPRSAESAHSPAAQPHRRGPQASGRRSTRALQSLSAGLSGLLDLLFPPRCPGCGVVADTFCTVCRATIRPRYDSGPLPSRRPVLAALWSAGAYSGQLRTAIQRFKYRGRTDLARPLARLLAEPAPGAGGPVHGPPAAAPPTWLCPCPSTRPAPASAARHPPPSSRAHWPHMLISHVRTRRWPASVIRRHKSGCRPAPAG